MVRPKHFQAQGAPWARSVEADLDKHAAQIKAATLATKSTASVQDGQIKRLAGQLQRIQAQQEQLADVVSKLGSLVKSANNSTQGFSYAGTSSSLNWNTISVTIGVPSGAQRVDINYTVNAVVCSNVSANVAAYSQVKAEIPTLGITSDGGANVFVSTDTQQQRSRTYAASGLSVSGATSITVTGYAAAYNTGQNDNNYLSISAFAIFSF
ncbi:hypothetical protein GCM10022286_05520 [Gryllotalpicola daejeonensis]|uniref:Uncharacterized protein n=1 Tax=Gryllotalpicola daejeonensis TaxID=993087 RepID=A0ABP7ZFC7_9MICO